MKNTFELAHSKLRSMRKNRVSRINVQFPGQQVSKFALQYVYQGCQSRLYVRDVDICISIREQLLAQHFCVYSACKR